MFIILGSGCRENIIIKNLKKNNPILELVCISDYINPQIKEYVKSYILVENKDNYNHMFNVIKNIKNKYNRKIIVIPGSEIFLKGKLVDLLLQDDINVIGPKNNMALIETSKSFCRNYLKYNNLNKFQPEYKIFDNYDEKGIFHYINLLNYEFVVKADGLYGGKGVRIYSLNNYKECFEYCNRIIQGGDKFVIEEKLYGEEFVLMSFCDGKNIKHMPITKDYKDLSKENDIKTGGMGSILLENHSMPFLLKNDIMECQELNKLIMLNLSRYDNIGYKGILYGSFMKTNKGIKLIEYNARFGDSECLNVIDVLKTPLELIFNSICDTNLNNLDIEYNNINSVCRYIVPNGYPMNSIRHIEIKFNLNKKVIDENIIFGGLFLTENKFKTTGSRICCIIDKNIDLNKINNNLTNIILNIDGNINYRNDIGVLNIENIKDVNIKEENIKDVYENCGVSIKEGDLVVKKISDNVKKTFNDNVIGNFGDYCGMYNITNIIKNNNIETPILVSSIDGVGTKTKFIIKYLDLEQGLKILADDIVNHSINDIIVKGAIPLYITDYIANNKIISDHINYFVAGLSESCIKNNIVLLGGETAELANTYIKSTYEIVANITGIIDKKDIINGKKNIKEGDYIYGIRSSGIHTNGYSVINKLMEYLEINEKKVPKYIMDILCKSHKSYLKEINYLNSIAVINGYSHITGGGYYNIERILDNDLGVEINIPIYDPYNYIMKNMNISEEEMYKIFNCGYGMLIFVNFENHIRIRDYEHIKCLGRVVSRKNKIKRINITNITN